MIEILKVKLGSGKIRIEYQQPAQRKDAEPDRFSLESADTPLESLFTAMNDLRSVVAAVCELPAEYCAPLEMRGLTLSQGDTMGVTITALKPLKNSPAPLVLNTPHTKESDLTAGELNRVLEVCHEASKYVRGLRAQSSLFGDDNTEVENDIESVEASNE